MRSLLEIRGLRKRFYGLEVLCGIDLDVRENEIVALIGPNGSGKSTLFNCVTGQYRSDGGTIHYCDRDITGIAPHRVSLAGLTRSFQMVQIYPYLTVLENLLLAMQEHQERNPVARLLRLPKVRRAEAAALDRAEKVLTDFNLLPMRDTMASALSYGQKKLVEFAAVLMPDPVLVMLDEPAAAVNPTMINMMKTHIRRLNAKGKAFLLIEHNMTVVMDISHRIVVLDHGEKIAEGSPERVRNDPLVLEAYFGR